MSGSGVVREMNRSRMAEAGYQNAGAALQNEQLTRQRVDRLERRTDSLEKTAGATFASLAEFCGRGFWGRLRWLLRGK